MGISRNARIWAALAPCALALPVSAPALAAVPQRIIVHPGQTPQQALWAARGAAMAASLKAKWLASHKVSAQTSFAAPTVTGGTVTASTLTVGQPGQYPVMSTSYTTDTPGLAAIYYIYVSPNGQSAYYAAYGAPAYTQTGTISFANVAPPSLWSEPGKWTLTSVQIIDQAGDSTTYDAAQIAALFTGTSFTIANTGMVDDVAPKIKSGKITTPTVSLSGRYPLLKGYIAASDAGSGLWEGYVLISPPGGGYTFYENVPLAEPLAKGPVPVNTAFAAYDSTGTYSIVGYAVCDFAMNCAGSTSDADVVKLLGTDTFTVTP